MDITTVVAWTTAHWQVTLGIPVVGTAVVLIQRAYRRSEERAKARGALSGAEQALAKETLDRRGRRIEDALTMVVASAAAYLSSTGLRKFGQDLMGLQDPWDWLPFVGLDMAALVCGLRARRRAANNEGPGLSGALVWVLLCISSLFSAAEGSNFAEGASRAVWPLLSGVLFELGSLEQRKAAREKEKRSASEWLDRRLAAVRMLHPVEWVRVQLALAGDEQLSQSEATRQVRVERAGYRLYRLWLLEKREARWWSTLPHKRDRADRRAQHAQSKLSTTDLDQMFEAFQRRTRTRGWAKLQKLSASEIKRELDQIVSPPAQPRVPQPVSVPVRETEPDKPSRTGTARTGTDGRTDENESHGTTPRTGTEEQAERVPQTRTGTDPVPVQPVPVQPVPVQPVPVQPVPQTRTGTPAVPEQPVPADRTARTGTATDPVPAESAQANTGTPAGAWTQKAILADMRTRLTADGTQFTPGSGIGKMRERYGIGTDKVKAYRRQVLSGTAPAAAAAETGTADDRSADTSGTPQHVPGTATGTAEADREPAVAIDLDKARPVPQLGEGPTLSTGLLLGPTTLLKDGPAPQPSDLVLAGPAGTTVHSSS